jgi:putative thiamine transport system permease protein
VSRGAARALALGAAALLYALPLLVALPWALWDAASLSAWQTLWADPQVPRALAGSVFVAVGSTALALGLALFITTHMYGSAAWRTVQQALGPLLALPHAAFAIGLAWLVAPSGWLARALAPFFGWDQPPAWTTVNDPHGLALMAALVLKELPFLLWNLAAGLARPEVASRLAHSLAVARTLGYPPAAAWWRVLWPATLPLLRWPLVAVLAYGLSVVDLALLLGPSTPPLMAVLAWQALTDANADRNAEGAVAAVLLTAVLLLLLILAALLWRAWQAWARASAAGGRRPAVGSSAQQARAPRAAAALCVAVVAAYSAATLALLALSLAGVWSFPSLWPDGVSTQAWADVASRWHTVGLTLVLALAATAGALLLSWAWLEAAPPQWDAAASPWLLAPWLLPQLLWLAGLYPAALVLRLDGRFAGLVWVHLLFVLPYVHAALAPAWRSFDARYEWAALALGRSKPAFWWHVKVPLLLAPLASAAAIGVAVSVAQFLPTQFIGASRHATLTTEAVTLASGGQRPLAAAFAFLQALLPLLAFALAAAAAKRALAQRA